MRLRSTIALVASAAVAAATLVSAPAAVAQEPPRPIVSGWFGWWATDIQVRQLIAESKGVVPEVAIFWWSFQGADNPLCPYDTGDHDKDGSWGDPLCKSSTPWTTPKLDGQRQLLQDAGVKVHASITDLGSATKGKLSAYLSTAKNRRAYARLITEYAVKAGVDGVDLDWEVFAFHDGRDSWPATRDRFVKAIKRLSKELHSKGLVLSVTIPGGQAYWGGSTGVYALKDIIDFADRVKFMTYDYSWNSPGPIGPAAWARAQLQAAIAEVGQGNAAKLWLGNPQYGREWALNKGSSTSPRYGTNDQCPAGWTPGYYNASGAWVSTVMRTISTPDAARAAAQSGGVEPEWREASGEWTFRYSPRINGRHLKDGSYIEVQCRVDREAWFGDTRSALVDASAVRDLQIGGIAVWNFGSVQSSFYSELAKYGREIAPATTTVTIKAPKAAKYGRTIPIRVETSSRAGVADGAEATLYFTESGGTASRTEVQSLTLSADGKGVFRVPATASGSWVVSVAGSWSRVAGESAPVPTAVRLNVTAQANATTIAAGTPVTISGAVSPAAQGLPVTVQRRSAQGEWRDVSSVTTGAGGTFTASVKPTVKGEAIYRMLAPAAQGLEAGVSGRIVITVK